MAKQNKPAIRFKGFTDAWEQRKLGEVVERITRKNENLESTLPLTISAQYGLINQNEFFDKRIASKDVSGYFLVRNGEFAYNKSTSSDAPWGAIKRLDRYESGVLSTLYIVFKISDERKTSSDYIVTYYNTDLWHKGIQAIAAEGARNHGLLNVAPADFFETNLTMPKDYAEQQQIGSFFQQLDHLITLHQRKFDKLQVLKKAMLEKMFPKNGQTKPEIRFSGFTDDWEQRKLGEYVSIISGEAPSKFEEGTELYVKVDDLNYNDKYVVDTQNKVAEHSTVKRVTKGSVVFPKRGAAIMTNKVRIIGIDSYMDTNMMALTSEKLDSEFLYNIISKEGLYKIADTSTIPQINNKHVEPYEVTIPSLDEQRRIGAYFKQLDHLITLHQRELEKLKKIKLSMLEKMFV